MTSVKGPMAVATRVQRIYDAPSGVVPPIRPYLRSVWERRHLIWHLSRTGAKAVHYDTVLGRLWVVVDPILTAFTFYIIRIVLIPNSRADAGAWIAHLIMAISFFSYFRRVFEGTARSIVSNQNMVLNCSAPRGVYPAMILTRAIYDFIPALAVYGLVHVSLGQPITPALVTLPIVFILLTLFGLGLGLALMPSVVFVRDMGEVLPHVARMWMYLSPIMFFVSEVPDKVAKFLVLNPLYPYFDALEHLFWGHMPTVRSMVGCAVWALVASVVGITIFLRKEREFAVRL